jgi:hypothetical protein
MLSPLRNRAGRRLREPFGKAGLTVAVIALVFAMLGGAYAAVGLNSKQKKEVKAIAKSFQDKGPAGPQGPAGAKGDIGAAGSNGSNGTNGTGATTESFGGAQHGCTEGGIVVKSASPDAVVCNGEAGEDGQTGFTETLPSGKTETGVFAEAFPAVHGEDSNGDTFTAEVTGNQRIPVSFTIPLSAPPSESTVVTEEQQTNEEVPAQCDSDDDGVGSFKEPQADPGNFCAFVQTKGNIALGPIATSTSEFGSVLITATTGSAGFVQGTWAVTAE